LRIAGQTEDGRALFREAEVLGLPLIGARSGLQ
jgi:hypothetical protein